MKILLAGAHGQLGRALQEVLKSHDVLAIDREHIDITQLQAVRDVVRGQQPSLVINAAAYNNVDEAESDPLAAFKDNALGPRNLAVVTAAHKIPLLHISTDYVFDGTSKGPYHEFDRPNPRS